MEVTQITNILNDINNLIENNYFEGNEEIIINLYNENAQIKNNEFFFKKLGRYKQIKKDDLLLKDNIKCSICHESFLKGEYKRNLPLCKHNFHKKCIDKWFKTTRECPICRCDYSKL